MFIVLASLMGCAQSDEQPMLPTVQTPQGEVVNVSIDSEFDLLQISQDEETIRAVQIGQDANNVPHIKLPEGNSSKLRVFLRKLGQSGDNATTSALLPAEVSYNQQTKKYRIVAKGPIQLQNAGDKFSQGQWYISAIWGKGVETGPARLRHTLPQQAPINTRTLSMENATEVEVPVVAPWTRIDNTQSGGETLTNIGLRFRPLGVLLSLKLTNGTVYPVEIANFKAALRGFSVNGHLSVENVKDQEMQSGAMPKFIAGATTEQAIAPEILTLEPFKDDFSPIYIWFYPTEDEGNANTHEVSLALSSKKRGTMDARLEPKDQFLAEPKDPEFQDFYIVDYTFSKKPEHGTYYATTYKLRSQLTITEYFIQEYKNKTYGYVEIYNPNVDPIVLENYGLIRVIDNESYGLPKGSDGLTQGFLFPQLSAIKDNTGRTHETLVLSLALKDNQLSPWYPNSLGINSDADVKNGKPRSPMTSQWNGRLERVHFVKKRETMLNGKYTLEGGRTMLVLMSGHLANNSSLQDPVPGDTNAPAFPEYINQAFEKGYCQYIVAVDNPYNSAKNVYSPKSTEAGVMNMDRLDALALVQRHHKNPIRRRGADATSLNNLMNLQYGSWGYYRDRVATNENHFRGRTAVQFTSDAFWHTYRQWYQARVNTGTTSGNREYLGEPYWDSSAKRMLIPLPKKVISPGVRRYVGNTKQEWDKLPPFDIRTSRY